MSEQQRQQLSALVDGEIDPALMQATVSALESNPALTTAWERYHLIGELMRGEGVDLAYRDIAARVHEQIETEPVPLARKFAHRPRKSRFGPFLGAALAAAAAFFAVFAVPQLFDLEQTAAGTPGQVAASDPPKQFQLSVPGRRWQLDRPALESKLDQFVVNHQASSPSSAIKGFFPYATVVGYEAGR